MHPYARATAYGLVTGLRSMAAPAAISAGRRGIGPLLIALALGELVADKLPVTPSRLAVQPLAFRVISGASSGWRSAGRDATPLIAAACGALGAAAGAYLGHAARRFAVKRLRLPDLLVAVAEDAIVVGAVLLLRSSD